MLSPEPNEDLRFGCSFFRNEDYGAGSATRIKGPVPAVRPYLKRGLVSLEDVFRLVEVVDCVDSSVFEVLPHVVLLC